LITTKKVGDVGYYKGAGGKGEGYGPQLPEGATSYYTGASAHGEPPGQWSGRLAEALGLQGDVSDQVMELVFGQFEAPDGTPIGNGPRNFPDYQERVERALARRARCVAGADRGDPRRRRPDRAGRRRWRWI
jgi:hypothetical protein